MECYQETMRAIERERINFLNKIDLVQPSFEEQHQLEWGRRYQEEELLSLRSGLEEVSREVEAETQQLRDREDMIRAIRHEQQQDRIKIQTLLALSQPIAPDITVVLQALAPGAFPPPLPRPPAGRGGDRLGRRPSLSRDGVRGRGSLSPSQRAAAAAVAATGEASSRRRPGADSQSGGAGMNSGGGGGEAAGDVRRTSAGGRRSFRLERADESQIAGRPEPQQMRQQSNGDDDAGRPEPQQMRQQSNKPGRRSAGDTSDGGYGSSSDEGRSFPAEEDDTDQEGSDDGGVGGGSGDDYDNVQPRSQEGEQTGGGVSYGLRPWRARTTETREDGEEEKGRASPMGRRSAQERGTALGGWRVGGGFSHPSIWSRKKRRRRPRDSDGGNAGAGDGRGGARKDAGASRLRCTRGYQEHLERRLELTQRHSRDLDRLDRAYHETLERDRQEREIQIQVQKENVAFLVQSLRRRTAEVEQRVAKATEDYLRLRHGAKEAQGASVAEQKECAEAKRKSRAAVARLCAAAEAEVQAIKQEGRRRLDDCTVGLREDLGAAEATLQRERAFHAAIKQRFEERVTRARDGVLLTRRRHRKLARRRAEEVVHLSDEMSALRRGVTELERRMFAAW